MQEYPWTYAFFEEFSLIHKEFSFSSQFRLCLEQGLAKDLKSKTGLNLEKEKGKFVLGYGTLNKHQFELGETTYCSCYTGTITYTYLGQIAWRSKSGRIYRPSDTDIDPDDIHFWFNKLEAEAIRNIYFKQKPKLRFNTEHLGFGLEIDHFFEEGVYLEVFLCENPPAGAIASIQATFAETVNAWNTKSEQQQGRQGYIHSYDAPHVGERNTTLYLDLGSASQKGLKKVLEALRDLGTIEKIRITSFPDI